MSITEKASYSDMMNYIEARLIPDMKAKQERGEVFTPLSLINGSGEIRKRSKVGGADKSESDKGMLDHLPVEVWNNPHLKWLDPANGIGNFPVCVYYRLMRGLSTLTKLPKYKTKSDTSSRETRENTTENRSRHIIENMLYMTELDSMNVAISKSVFCEKIDGDTIEGNIIEKDFLEGPLPREWPDKFDVIMGNPPYNGPQKSKGKRGGGNDIWSTFVKDCLELLTVNGLLLFVTPAGWRKPSSDRSKFNGLFQLMSHDNHMMYLEIHNTTDGLKIFKSGTRFDIYVIKKASTGLTDVVDEKGNTHKLDLRKWEWFPNFDYDNIARLLATDDEDRCQYKIDVLFESSKYETRKLWTIEDKDKKVGTHDDYKYKLVHSLPNSGHRFFYSNRIQTYEDTKEERKSTPAQLIGEKVFFGVPKVIFGESFDKKKGIQDSIIDMKGSYGMTQGAMAIRVKTIEQAQLIKKALESQVFLQILAATSFGNYRIDWRLFTYLKRNWYESLTETPQYGGKKLIVYIRPYLKQHSGNLKTMTQYLRSKRIDRITKSQHKSLYGLVNHIQAILNTPLNEGKFTTLVKNVTDRNALKQFIRSKFIPESTPSERLRPMYKKYLAQFQLN